MHLLPRLRSGDHDEKELLLSRAGVAHLEKYYQRHGQEYAEKIRDYTIALYKKCAEYALSKGIIIADTKFEFGLMRMETLCLAMKCLHRQLQILAGRWI